MTTAEILALSLLVSVMTAGLGYGAGRLFERAVPDPDVRERVWSVALYLPLLPVILVAALLAGPAQVIEVQAAQGLVTAVVGGAEGRVPTTAIHPEMLASIVLGLALVLTTLRGIGLGLRVWRLGRLIRSSRVLDAVEAEGVAEAARRLHVAMPDVRLGSVDTPAMITGFWRPILILPEGLLTPVASSDCRAVCDHELAHLKRGDHRAVWIEEVVLTVLAANPVLTVIRDRRAAAREEACDGLALRDATAGQRRLYAQTLLNALRRPAGLDVPALTFIPQRRTLVMRRLKAVLSPLPVAGMQARLSAVGLGVGVAAVAGMASAALAANREAHVVVVPEVAAAVAPVVVVNPTPITEAAVAASPRVRAEPAPRPEPAPVPATVDEVPVITNPVWTQHPIPSYPAAALEQGLTSGSVDLSCAVEASGAVSACSVLREDPVGVGYGAAALAAAAQARLAPRTVERAATGGIVRFTVRFRIAAD